MRSNIFDVNKKEVVIGDTIKLPYVDPMGRVTGDFEGTAKVIFKFGCFGYEGVLRFVPLMEWMKTKAGDYVPNNGNKTLYTEKYPFEVITE